MVDGLPLLLFVLVLVRPLVAEEHSPQTGPHPVVGTPLHGVAHVLLEEVEHLLVLLSQLACVPKNKCDATYRVMQIVVSVFCNVPSSNMNNVCHECKRKCSSR
jgi:hypothetical protein